MNKLDRLILMIGTVRRLGLRNVLYVAYYRFSLKLGFRKKRFPIQSGVQGVFYKATTHKKKNVDRYLQSATKRADEIMRGEFTYYHCHKHIQGEIPNWFNDPFSHKSLHEHLINRHWIDINEFDLNTGDIKNLWEISRFDWVTDLARAYAITLDEKYLERLNILLNDWSEKNPINTGINWRCGQETAIRLMKLYNASVVLGSVTDISPTLFSFVFSHLQRIDGNIGYAIAQDNNHGTSEAAGLYVGSLWLLSQKTGIDKNRTKQLLKYKIKGRRVFENRINKLILSDGTFAQKSVNYHRVVVDTIAFTLFAMQLHNESPFKTLILNKLAALNQWLYDMISNEDGEVSNMGTNDGAMFENLHSCDYRDFRPSVQLLNTLLYEEIIWEDEKISEPLYWRGINIDLLSKKTINQSISYKKDNEFVKLAYCSIIIYIRATQDNFRPTNDILHIDVWYKGRNILIDSGSFSYNHSSTAYYGSIAAHNTLQFGDDEPMPRISCFLNGKWVKVTSEDIVEDSGQVYWKGQYKDYRGNHHQREVFIFKSDNSIQIKDSYISNCAKDEITLRFNKGTHFNSYVNIQVLDERCTELTPLIEQQYHSLYYMDRQTHEQLIFKQKGTQGVFQTTINFKK